ncbi:MAG: hypothetical protein ACOC5T_08620 [Elusimicrobiota bacterium]
MIGWKMKYKTIFIHGKRKKKAYFTFRNKRNTIFKYLKCNKKNEVDTLKACLLDIVLLENEVKEKGSWDLLNILQESIEDD